MNATGGSSPRTSVRTFRAEAADDGQPLERVLMRRLRLSRRGARRLLDTRRVFVNGRRVWIAHHRVRAGDHIETPAVVAPFGAVPIRVLYEDEELLVVDKPAGIVTTGEEGVEGRLQRERGEPELRAVHRLDRDTTGCLLLARSAAARERLVEDFRAGRVRKRYRAIAIGRWPAEETEIRRPIEGRSALTRVRVIAANAMASHLVLEIETGRTHQIRRHLAGRGHPVAGDPLYSAGVSVGPELRAVPRPMLHAEHLELPGASGRRVAASAPLPADFLEVLRLLGLFGRPGPTGGARAE
ncbi:MAG: RluA family pseudouridine synthase [Kiritimatiellae bacterium]|nr:RluA family pseudouridine synthase [Kiritimatiellia bacterium]